MAMMLTLSKRIIEVDHRMRRAPDIPRNEFIGNELLDQTIGIIGIGNVGGRLAELCRGLFRMRVLAYDPYLTAAQIAAQGAEKVEKLDDLLRQADYVSINCPYTRGDAEHDGRARIRADAAARLFRHHRAWRHPRRGRAGRGAARQSRSPVPGWMCGRTNRRRTTTS